MSSPSPLHRLATQHFDKRYKRKQSESFLSQPELTIWASRYRKPISYIWVFFLKVVYNSCKLQSVLLVIISPFLEAGFANILPTFLISCEVQTRYSKPLKYSEQYIRDHLSGTKVSIWISYEYDAVFTFSCIALCNLSKSFTFSFISFLL